MNTPHMPHVHFVEKDWVVRCTDVDAARLRYQAEPTKKNFDAAVVAISRRLQLESPDGHIFAMLELADIHRLPLPASLFWHMFKKHWSTVDWTWKKRDDILEALRFHEPRPPLTKRLRFPLVVYRGCMPNHVHGISWSLSREVAERFAAPMRNNHWQTGGVVAQGIVEDASAVFFYNGRGGERELVSDPDKVHIVKVSAP